MKKILYLGIDLLVLSQLCPLSYATRGCLVLVPVGDGVQESPNKEVGGLA